ncbi:Bug family tripartite tricarboxylate transporter substrate binding protein [Roseateles sp. 22389]|uniref:Bug family tripartite tricarboxylate transporter substrate binding protein n=1 Tax=Roseateles sp. 22389 TaxID=3453916 RepID=UPI003F84C549
MTAPRLRARRTALARSGQVLALAAAALLAAALPRLAAAQASAPATDWPTRPVRILTPFPAGAGPETVARVVAEKLSKKWGKPVIVENKPGANGFIAIDAFKRGATDGHDLIQLDNAHLVIYPHLFKKLPYDPVKDFDPIAPLFKAYFFVGVSANSKYKTVGDIVADAKAHPGALNYGSWSVGNPVHLGAAQLEAMTQTQMTHVVYKETSMLYTAVANGELNFALGTMATAGPLQRAGKIRFIAITSPKRHPAFPDVPTVAESGGPAGYEATGWTTIAAPRGLPKAVQERIQRDIEAALAEPDIRERYVTFGYDIFPTTKEQYMGFISAESAKYAALIKRFNLSLD